MINKYDPSKYQRIDNVPPQIYQPNQFNSGQNYYANTNSGQQDILQTYSKPQIYHQFLVKFPRLNSYNDIEQIRAQFIPMKYQNNSIYHFQLGPNDIVKMIRPNGLINIHKALKYGVWTSIGRKTIDLIVSWELASKKGGRVILIFLPLYSDIIVGIAMMNSEFCSNKHFRLWDRANKYFGLCGLEWIYVKNISTMDIPPLIDQDGSTYQLSQLQDGLIINYEDAKPIFLQFQTSPNFPSIFKEFSAFDISEDQMRSSRNNNQQFEDQFQIDLEKFEYEISQYLKQTTQQQPKYHDEQDY